MSIKVSISSDFISRAVTAGWSEKRTVCTKGIPSGYELTGATMDQSAGVVVLEFTARPWLKPMDPEPDTFSPEYTVIVDGLEPGDA